MKLYSMVHFTSMIYICNYYPQKFTLIKSTIDFIHTLKSKKLQEANELLLELHEFNYKRKNGLDPTEIEQFYILWLMNWFSDGIIRKQKSTLHRREKSDFPKE